VVGIAAAYFAGGFAAGMYEGYAATTILNGGIAATIGGSVSLTSKIIAGAVGGLASSGGDLKAAFQGAVTGGAFGYVGGTWAGDTFGNYAGHALVGCASGAMNGGGGEGCARGAVSQVISKWVTLRTETWGPAGQFAAATIAGGTTSAITGGKFATGAQTAAFGYLFNQLAPKSDIACSENGSVCTKTTYEERRIYTGEMKVIWQPVNWEDPTALDFTFDLSKLLPHPVVRWVPGLEFKLEGATQRGEILHEVRIDRQYFRITIENHEEVSRVPLNYEKRNTYRWESAPGTRDLLTRQQFQSCMGSLCAEFR
jgi:hypothetical protein